VYYEVRIDAKVANHEALYSNVLLSCFCIVYKKQMRQMDFLEGFSRECNHLSPFLAAGTSGNQ
jgi:hypothetical protein